MERQTNWKRQVSIFLSGQAFSLFGSAIVQYAIIWHITLSTNSGVYLTVATVCGLAPQVLISLFAGVWADRYNRKVLVVLSDAFIAASTLLVAFVFLYGYTEIWLLFVISAVRSLGSGIQTPAATAIVPQLVPTEKLMKFGGLSGTLNSLVFLVAPAASGALLAVVPLEYVFFIDVVTALVGIIFMIFVKVPTVRSAEPKSVLSDLVQGLKYAKAHTLVKNIIVVYAVFMFMVTPAAFLSPLLITRVFGGDYWRFSLNEMAFSLGALLGGGLIIWWGGFKERIKTISFSFALFGIMTILTGAVCLVYAYLYKQTDTMFIIFLAVMLLSGITMPMFSVPSNVMLQERVETEMQGRMQSLVQIVSSSALPVGMLIFGPLSEVLAIEYLMLATGAIISLLGAVIYARKKHFM